MNMTFTYSEFQLIADALRLSRLSGWESVYNVIVTQVLNAPDVVESEQSFL